MHRIAGLTLFEISTYSRLHGRALFFRNTVGTKIIAGPEKCFQELISEKLLILLRDRPCLELIIVSSNLQALLFLRTNYWNQSDSY